MTDDQWNFDISVAPGPHVVTRSKRKSDGTEVVWQETMPTFILICLDNPEKTVMTSYFIPERPLKNGEGAWPARWCGLATGQVPLAWRYYPKHPMEE